MRVGTRWTLAVLAAVLLMATRATAHGHGHHGKEHHHHHSSFDVVGFGRTKIYAMAIGASLVTACASLVCVAMIPLLASTKGSASSSSTSTSTSKRRRSTGKSKKAAEAAPSEGLVRTLSAFAVGALLGDAFLHQLPHAYAKAATGEHGGHGGFASTLWSSRVGLAVVVGCVAFYLVERTVDHSHGGHGHSHRYKKDDDAGEEERKGTVGYLNLIADAVHNFTDGAAVGLAFLSGGPAAGWAKTLVMLAHEVPQEIGDFGVLVGCGV
jgi:zinc transporter 7